jgi:hypothetical protein
MTKSKDNTPALTDEGAALTAEERAALEECWEAEKRRPIDNEFAAEIIRFALKESPTQADFVKTLRSLNRRPGFNGAVTDLFADMLSPHGHNGWKLTLKRASRGAPKKRDVAPFATHLHDGEANFVTFLYDQEVEKGGKYGAVKRLSRRVRMSLPAIRSAIRRAKGTHGRRRKGGHK